MRIPVALLTLLAACHGTPPLPEGSGRGLIAFDPAPPAGAQVWERPTWHQGDHFVLLRGGKQRLDVTVAVADEKGYLLVDSRGSRLQRGLDLSNLAEYEQDVAQPAHELTPGDFRYHWPLWLGKRWRCQYADRTAGGQSLPVENAYEVEALDTVVTPGGTFKALRILRTSRLLVESDAIILDRTSVIWYAPDLGLEVRQILGDTSVELVSWTQGKQQ